MGDVVLTGFLLGAVGYLVLGLALGWPVSSWHAANLAGLAVAAALGVALAWWGLPRPWLSPLRHLAAAALMLWVGVRMAFPREDDVVARGLRPWGWITLALGGVELLFAFLKA
jgi:phosphate/sulfate permease